jgi:hypothetical protein
MAHRIVQRELWAAEAVCRACTQQTWQCPLLSSAVACLLTAADAHAHAGLVAHLPAGTHLLHLPALLLLLLLQACGVG